MHFQRKDQPDEALIAVYKELLLPRLIEERMLMLLRQGRISKWFSGIGQEAIAVGATLAMQPDEWIMPLHRNLGVFSSRGMPLNKLFRQWQGDREGYSRGRERSFHFGSEDHHICGMISHLGPQLGVADGVALAYKLKHSVQDIPLKACLAFTGEGGTSEGDFHEALNLASVWDLPVIFLIENNGYGLSTPVHEQYRCERLVDRAKGYGMDGVQIDGNNILEVMDTVKGVREYCIRYQRPYLIECSTFRMRGHEEASGIKYVPAHLLEAWREKDPIANYERFLREEGIITEEGILSIQKTLHAYIEEELKHSLESHVEDESKKGTVNASWLYHTAAEQGIMDTVMKEELRDVYATPRSQREKVIQEDDPELQEDAREIRLVDAIQEGLFQSMEKHDRLVLMGQDIADYGGVFKVTEGFADVFGKERVRNTPLCESAVIGAALGLSLEGYKSMVEMQFADFVTMGFNQIVNNLAKIHYRWGASADVVIRMPTGGGVGAGPFHSQSNEAWFIHTPGLKVVYPSCPADAKGLLIAAINDPNPVLFFEHKALYRSLNGMVPASYYETPIGKARIVQEGKEMTIITYGAGVHWSLAYAASHPEISFYILDLRTLLPLDYEAVKQAVQATGKVLILHEDTLTGGVGAEISAWITEHCFEWLDAPVMRCASLDTPVPFNAQLESNFLAKARMDEVIGKLIAY